MKKQLTLAAILMIASAGLVNASSEGSNCTSSVGFGFYKIHNDLKRTLWYTASLCCNPLGCCSSPNWKRLPAGQRAILCRIATSQIHFTTSLSQFNVMAAGMSDAAKTDDAELYYTPQKKGAYNLHLTLDGNNSLKVRETGTEWKPCGKEEVELK